MFFIYRTAHSDHYDRCWSLHNLQLSSKWNSTTEHCSTPPKQWSVLERLRVGWKVLRIPFLWSFREVYAATPLRRLCERLENYTTRETSNRGPSVLRCLQGIPSLETKGHRHGTQHYHQEVTNKNHCKGLGRQFVRCLPQKHEDPTSIPGAHTRSQLWCCASLQLQSRGGRDKRISAVHWSANLA